MCQEEFSLRLKNKLELDERYHHYYKCSIVKQLQTLMSHITLAKFFFQTINLILMKALDLFIVLLTCCCAFFQSY